MVAEWVSRATGGGEAKDREKKREREREGKREREGEEKKPNSSFFTLGLIQFHPQKYHLMPYILFQWGFYGPP